MNNKIKSSLETEEGKIMFCIVREFLEFFNLDCTLSVYEPESYLGKVYQYEGRHTVAEKLGLEGLDDGDSHVPLLLMLIRFVQLMKHKSIHLDKMSVAREIKSNELNDIKNTTHNLNTTYELSKPTINLCVSNNEEHISTPNVLNHSENTQSLDSFDYVNKLQDTEVASQPILKDGRNNEKLKSDKMKSKSTSETSPFQNNKSRVSDILPSLYNKEYKEKSGIRDLDKIFDIEIEYEEDFMHSRDLSLQCDYLKCESDDILSSNCRKTIKTDPIEIIPKIDISSSNELTGQEDHSNNA